MLYRSCYVLFTLLYFANDQMLYRCVQLAELDAKGKVLPASSGEYKVIQKIAERVIKAVQEGRGGGFQDHVSKCAPTNQTDNFSGAKGGSGFMAVAIRTTQ